MGAIKNTVKYIGSKFSWDTLPYTAMYLAAILIIGMLDVVDASFNPFRILTADYWIEVGLLTLANSLVLAASTNTTIVNFIKTDEDVIKLKHLIRQAKLKLKPNFSIFMHKLNMKRKRVAYEDKLLNQITKLEESSDYYTRIAFLKAQQNIIDYNKRKSEGQPDKTILDIEFDTPRERWYYTYSNYKSRQYFKKMKELKVKYSDEYITENLELLRVSYPEIKESFIKLGVDKQSIFEYEVESGAKKKIRDLGPKFLYNVGLGMFIASFIMVPQDAATGALIISIAIKMLILSMNWNRGKNYGPIFVTEKVMADDQYRLDKMLEYLKEEGVNTDGL